MNRYLFAIAVLLLPSLAAAREIRGYSVGNSLTIDAIHWVDGLVMSASQRGHTYVKGAHLRGGVGLETIWQEFETGTWDVYHAQPSKFDTALVDHTWDVINLQPFYDSAATEVAAARKFIDHAATNPANASALIYIYATWPAHGTATTFDPSAPLNFSEAWNAPYTSGPVGYRPSAAYYEQIVLDLRAEYGDDRVRMIPVGHVWALIEQRIESGEITEISSLSDLYRDAIHTNSIGQYVAAMTHYATLFADDPRGLSVPAGYSIPAGLAPKLQQAIWDVVSTHPYTAVPEPSMLGLAAPGVLAMRRWRR